MDTNHSGEIDRKKFLSYLDKIQGSENTLSRTEFVNEQGEDVTITSESSGTQSLQSPSTLEISNENQVASQGECIPQPPLHDSEDEESVSSLGSIENSSGTDSESELSAHQLFAKMLQEKTEEFVSLPEYLRVLQLVVAHFKEEHLRDELARIFHHLDVQSGRSGIIKRENLVAFLGSDHISDIPKYPESETSPKNTSFDSSNSSILWPSPSKSSPTPNNQSSNFLDHPKSSQSLGARMDDVYKLQNKNTTPQKFNFASGRKVVGQSSHGSRTFRHNHSPTNFREQQVEMAKNETTIISPHSSFPGHDSYFQLSDDQIDSPPNSSYNNGILIASALGISDLEVPENVVSLIYEKSNSNLSRKRKPVGVHLVHTIILSHNSITTIQFDKLLQFSSLIHLDLSFNQIETVIDSFPVNLQSLKLNRNKIKIISGLLLCRSLTDLNISFNQIKVIDGLPKNLKKLDISGNLIDKEMNLRMLSLCPDIVSLNIDHNPVVYHLKNWRARLFSLLPKLEEINFEILPKARRHSHIVPSQPLTSYSLDISPSKSRFSSKSLNLNKTRDRSPKRSNRSPSKVITKSEQEASDMLRYKEYESLRKSREKIEKDTVRQLRLMANSVHKKALPAEKLVDISIRLNNWKPLHVKKMEENEKARQALDKEKIAKKQRKQGLIGANRKPKNSRESKQRESLEEIQYSQQVAEWMKYIQLKLSASYETICQIFREVQLILKELFARDDSKLSAIPEIPYQKYIQSIDILRNEIYPLTICYNLISRNLIEDCIGWNADVNDCLTVLKLLRTIIGSFSNQLHGIQTLGDHLSDIVTSLQMNEEGQPLEFVSWKAGSNKCLIICSLLPHTENSTRGSINISTFSPINKVESTLDDSTDNFEDHILEGDSVKFSVSVVGPLATPTHSFEIPPSPSRKLTQSEIDARMENVKLRALQRAGVDVSPPKGVSPSLLNNGTPSSSAFTEVKHIRPNSRNSPMESIPPSSEFVPSGTSSSEHTSKLAESMSIQPVPAQSMISSLQSALDESHEDLSPMKELPTITRPSVQTISVVQTASTDQLKSEVRRMDSRFEDMEKDDINARDLFSRMGSLKEKIMKSSSRNLSEGDGEYRSRSNSNVSHQSPRSDASHSSQIKKSISKLGSESEDDTGNDSSVNSSATGMSALERLRLKVANAKSGNS